MSETLEQVEQPSSMDLETGQAIAWVTRQGRKMCGLSSVHRVYDRAKTYCQREIPDEDRRFPPLKSLNVCHRCDTLWRRAEAVVMRDDLRERA